MFVSLVTICLFVGLLVTLLYDQYNRAGRLVRQIPGPKRWPIVGNTINFLLPLDKLFLFIRNLPKEYGDVVQIHAINERTIGFLDPDNVETILSSLRFSDKNIPYNFMRPWLGEGLLTSQGLKWHQRRKLLTQAFHFNILKKYSITFVEQTDKFLHEVQEKVNEKHVDIVPLITSTTLRIMCETAMGTSMHESIESVASKYSRAIEVVGKAIVERMCRIWLHVDYFFKWSSVAKAQEAALKDLHTFTNKIIKERRMFLKENRIETFEDEESYGNKGRLAMLDLLLEKEKVGDIDVDGIREEVDTFMFEGHDTTAQALSFLIMTIANETKVQDKIYEELQNIFKGSQNTPTTDELNEMKYLECCIKESLRLYPSVPIILRYVTEETIIGGFTIPKNSHIHISIYDLHRRADIFPEPERFIPERFLPEVCAKRHPYAYIPFSAGPRNCIGQKFAMLEMKTLVSSLLRRFRLEAVTKPSDLRFRADILLRTNNESLYVKFFNRC
ncbi:cytochrome P450 4C1-like isoform X2 [Nymphalis io]|uniref:cytochrome P450 4C1-like isoform X2 n=1 Tax=Inachis io TaxID=171585 RepID=UPI00216A1789|nr:cytochrome P450 4C1-like isoform X2 [Nymphalis io]